MRERFRNFLIRVLPGLILVIVIQSYAIAFFDVPISGDSIEYLQLGKNLHDKGLYSFDSINPTRMRQPVYPVFLSLTYYSLGESYLLVKLIHALANIVSFLLILKLYELICGANHLRFAALCIGAYVPLWWTCSMILSEPLAILLVTCFIFVLHGLTTRWTLSKCMIAGILLGLAILTRPITISLLGFVWIPIVFNDRFTGRKIVTLGSLVAACLIALLPWSIRNYNSFGKLTPLSAEGEYHAFRAGEFAADLPKDSVATWEELRDSLASKSLLGLIVDEVRQDPVNYIWNGVKRVIGTWVYFPGSRTYFNYLPAKVLSYTVQSVFLALAVFGFWKLDKGKRLFLIYPALSFSIIIFFSSEGISRLLLPILPAVLIATVVGITTLAGLYRNRWLKIGA